LGEAEFAHQVGGFRHDEVITIAKRFPQRLDASVVGNSVQRV
jgi:hypothetical protein